MPTLGEIGDALKVVATAVESVRKIVAAVRDGLDYVRVKHPDVKPDLALLVGEMRKTMVFVAQASAVVTRFRFVASATPDPTELARFNDHVIAQKDRAAELRASVDTLRGHCSVVRAHAFRIAAGARGGAFHAVFERLGLRSAAREKDLADRLDRLSYEDYLVADSARAMLSAVEAVLTAVQDHLSVDGLMHPDRVPGAARLLADCARSFAPVEADAQRAADEISEAVAALG